MKLLPRLDRLAHRAMVSRGLRSRWIDVKGRRVHVYDGKGRGALPPVVLLHGLSAAGASFMPIVTRLLPRVRRVIVPERVGHGRSPHPGAPVTVERLFETMTEALDQVLDEPAVVLGNSLGGAVAIEYAIRRPKKVRGLLLVSPAGARVAEDEWRELLSAFAFDDRAGAKRFFDRVYHKTPWFLALLAHEFPDVVRRQAVQDILATATVDHAAKEDELAALAMPILLVWGRSERLLPHAALAWFEEHLPKHAVIEQPDAFGHAPQLEQPARVAERILDFARQV
jgi:pimeloyl-ACP methyl ester carboxylesterase